MTIIKHLKLVIILIIIETVLFVLFRRLHLIKYVPEGYGFIAILLYITPPLVGIFILLKQKKLVYSYIKIALSFLLVLISSNILSFTILKYVFNLYFPLTINPIIFISLMFIIPAFISPLFTRFVKEQKDRDILDN